MNRDQAKQFIPILQAFADGKTIEYYSEVDEQWKPLSNPIFSYMPERYRIKPETIKIEHRRYLYKYHGYLIGVCDSRAKAEEISTSPGFIRWIDPDWITGEVEINSND